MTAPVPDRTRQDVQDTPAPATSPTPAPDSAPGAGVIEEAAGWIEDEGAFVLPLGAGVRLGSDVLAAKRGLIFRWSFCLPCLA
ncbi:hypothetical protein LH51_10955 [Nitrincola sp. A-D6]|uniref:hypothetical protein n=1 Tax=Nitrincola sp. A-D6 TaxID=1545442 RepID=UPI00051F92B5|nr:hypothetical protein [Nitrincola sp. A-D6]KGK41931.1 hypothetical protein LH51_10955 [Nitrincola sp. A-D6]